MAREISLEALRRDIDRIDESIQDLVIERSQIVQGIREAKGLSAVSPLCPGREAEILRKIADNVCIKVPLTIDGLKTCKKLTGDGTMVNVTLCFSANQALLAAKAGATFVSPFVGRHDDNGFDGMDLIRQIRREVRPHPIVVMVTASTDPTGRGSATWLRRWKVSPRPGPSKVITASPRARNASPHQCSSSFTALVPLNATTTGCGPSPSGRRSQPRSV